RRAGADLGDAVADLDTGRVSRAFRIDVANFDAQLGIIPHRQNAKEGRADRAGGAAEDQFRVVDLFLAAQQLHRYRVSFVFRAQPVQHLGHVDHWLAVNLLNDVARLDTGL